MSAVTISRIAPDKGDAGHGVEGDVKAKRTLDQPPCDGPAAMPKRTMQERLRRPLLIAFPVILAVIGAAYYWAEEPYISTDDAFVYAAKESINARVAGQVVEIAVRNNQRV